MNKEIVNLNLDNTTGRLPYSLYYRSRNGNTAKEIARYMGLPYTEQIDGRNEAVYTVPAVTLDPSRAKSFVAKTVDDFYGTKVEYLGHVGKAILHPVFGKAVPSFYSSKFAQVVTDYTLPGYSVFTPEAAIEAYRQFPCRETRVKLTNESDGLGQFTVKSEMELTKILKDLDPKMIKTEGLVLEPNLRDATTISVGYIILGSLPYSFIAHQKNDIAEDGRNRYLGARVLICKGGLRGLNLLPSLNSEEREAVAKADGFNEAYGYFNPVASRLSFDCLFGQTENGESLSGITDITARLGGTCPALVLAVNKLKIAPTGSVVLADVNLNYNPDGPKPSYERKATTFVEHSTLRLTAKVKDEF